MLDRKHVRGFLFEIIISYWVLIFVKILNFMVLKMVRNVE